MSGTLGNEKCESAPNVKARFGTEKKGWSRKHANETDLIGRRFGKLTVIAFFGKFTGRWSWVCECDCGNEIIVHRDNLVGKNTKSCGCLKMETLVKHGMYKAPEFKAWVAIKQRCSNQKLPCYVNYGGRGISVCGRWLESFNNFYADMGDRPSEKHSIERKDNNGNYEPDNCKWATKSEQQRNLRVRKNSSSGVKGVRLISWTNKFTRRCKYEARFFIDGKNKTIGSFDTLKEAAEARRQAEIKYWDK